MGELRYRTRIGVIMDNDIFDWLKAKSSETQVPHSRIIEKALMEVYGKEIEEFKKNNKEAE